MALDGRYWALMWGPFDGYVLEPDCDDTAHLHVHTAFSLGGDEMLLRPTAFLVHAPSDGTQPLLDVHSSLTSARYKLSHSNAEWDVLRFVGFLETV